IEGAIHIDLVGEFRILFSLCGEDRRQVENDTEMVFLKKFFEKCKVENVTDLPMTDKRLKHLVERIEVESDNCFLLISKVVDQTMTNFPICSSDQNDFLV